MVSPNQNFTHRLYHGDAAPLPAGLALLIYAVATASFFAIMLTLGTRLWVSVVAQTLALVALPVLALRLHGAAVGELGLRRPTLGAVVGALLLGAGLWFVSLSIAAPIIEVTGRGEATRALSRQLLRPDIPLAWIIIANAIVPGICEELLHRGLLLGALVPRWGRGTAVAITTGLFAAIHLEPARMTTTAVLGLAAGLLAVFARSVWPAVVLHVTNNTIALCLAAGLAPSISRALATTPTLFLAVAAILCACGFALSWHCRRKDG